MSESNAFGNSDLGEQEDVIMRNKDVNRQVLKAISIGLTAALSLMPTVTAFADDDTSGEGGSSNETNESASENTEQSENQEARESCDEAFEACESAVELAEESFSEETASSESDGAGAPVASESDGAGAPAAGEGDVIGAPAASESDGAGAPAAGEGDVIGAPAACESDGAGAPVADSSALGDDQIQTIIDNLTDAAQIVGITKQSPDDGNGTGLPANIENSDESGIKENDDSLENAVAALDETNKEAKTFNENHKTEDEEQKLEEAIGGAEEMVEKAKAGTATDAEVEEALEKADKAVEEAEKNKAEAERLVDKATTELEAILADCDVKYDVDPETGDITVTDEEKLDTRTRTALEKAQAAVDAARQKDADAQAALDEAQSLNKWLGMVKDQMQVVSNSTDKGNKKTEGTKIYEGYKLAAYLQAYQVSTWEGVDPDSVEVVYDTTFKGNYNERNFWSVKYKNAGDDCYHRVYLDLHFDKVDNLDSLIASEHLVLEEAPYAFADKCNENLRFGVNKDGSLIADAITGEVDSSQQAAYDAVKAEIDRLMSGNIKDATVKAKLTVQMAKLYLAGQGYDIDRIDTPYWYNVSRGDKTGLAKGMVGEGLSKDDQRYIPIRYTAEDGSIKDFYFVYNINNGNAVSIYQRTPTEMTCAYNDYAEDGNHRFMLDDHNHGNGKDPDAERRYDLNSILGQEAGYNELQNNKTKANGLLEAVEKARNKVVAAQQALLNVQKVSAVYNADIQKFKDRLAAAQQEYNELKAAAEEAAAEEAAGNSDNVTNTTPDGGGSTGGTTDTSTGGTTADGGSAGGTTTDGGSTDGTTSDGGSTGGGDVTEAASSDGASVDITASIPGTPAGAIAGAGVLGETAPAAFADLSGRSSAVDAGAFADISDIESGVLDEGGDLLEEGVLGERMAPIVDAVNNGTFKRSMLFVEDGLQVSFMWWLIMLALGAKGVQMYVKSRRKEAKETEPEK